MAAGAGSGNHVAIGVGGRQLVVGWYTGFPGAQHAKILASTPCIVSKWSAPVLYGTNLIQGSEAL